MSYTSESMFLSKERFREAMRKGMEEDPNFKSSFSDGEYAWWDGQQIPIQEIKTYDDGTQFCWFYRPGQTENMTGVRRATFLTDAMQPLKELNELIEEDRRERRMHRIKLGAAALILVALIVALLNLTGCGSGATVDKVTDGIDASGITPTAIVEPTSAEDEEAEAADEAAAEPNESTPSGSNTSSGSTSGNAGGNASIPPASSKPSATPGSGNSSGGSTGVGSSSGNSGSSGGTSTPSTPATPSTPSHTHSWTYHEAVTEQVWIPNKVYIPRYTCGHCGTHTYSSADADAHQKAERLETGTGYAYYSSGYYEDQGHYETRTVSNAYYSCSCGATK